MVQITAGGAQISFAIDVSCPCFEHLASAACPALQSKTCRQNNVDNAYIARIYIVKKIKKKKGKGKALKTGTTLTTDDVDGGQERE